MVVFHSVYPMLGVRLQLNLGAFWSFSQSNLSIILELLNLGYVGEVISRY